MGWTLHVLLLDHGTGVEDCTTVVGTTAESAAAELHRHLLRRWPNMTWDGDPQEAIQRIARDGEPLGMRVRHLTLDLERALAHEHDGEDPTISIIPASAFRELQASLSEGFDRLRQREQGDEDGGDPDGLTH